MARDFGISLASWSLHRSMGEGKGKFPLLDMPKVAREELGIACIELSRTLVPSIEPAYLDKLSKNAADHDVYIHLIMVNAEGELGAAEEGARNDAVVRHKAWIDAAAYLGCKSVRVNWGGAPKDIVQDALGFRSFVERSVPAMRALCDYGDRKNVNIILENHGGASSCPEAVVQLMAAVDHPRFGTLPDFGNFPAEADKYLAVDLMMSFAKAVSAKCYDFDPHTGEETSLDFGRLIEIVVDKHGYSGYVGIEYEGDRMSEFEGIRACKRLLERLLTP
ncbi:MAG: TIM barrel protein [Nitrospiraceae bacterium]|nr:TIM barrel protein [Nitrospiraceae bacterium]